MTEIFYVLFFCTLLSLIFFAPFLITKKKFNKPFYFDDYDLSILNILFLLNSLLIFIIIGFTINNFIFVLCVTALVLLFYFLINFKKFDFNKKDISIFIFFILISYILSINLSNNLSLYWDAQKIWLPKALVFYNDGLISNLKDTTYPHYSFLGSLIWALFWKISNVENEYFGRIFFISFYCFSLLNLISLIKVYKYIRIILFLVLVLLTYNYWHFDGKQEILIFSIFLILSKYFINLIVYKKKDNHNLIFIILCLNLIIWIKNEGVLISLLVLLLFILFFKNNIKLKILISSLIFLMILVRFFIFKLSGLEISLSNDFDFLNLFSDLINNLSTNNVLIILKYIIFSLFKFPHILLSILFAIIIAMDKKLFRKYLFLYVYLFLSLSLIFFIYLSTSLDLRHMVSTGSLRLMFEFSAPYLLFSIIYFKEKYKV